MKTPGSDDIKIQSIAYKNYEEFFNDVKPPYFENYKIVFKDGTNGCFNNALARTLKLVTFVLMAVVTLLV